MTRVLAFGVFLVSALMASAVYYWLLVTLEVFHGGLFSR